MADTQGLDLGGAVGGVLGGFAGGLFGGKKKTANLAAPKTINQFQGALGSSTPTGFNFSQDPTRQAAIDAANQNLANLTGNGLAIDQSRLNAFRDAFIQARSPTLENALSMQQDALNASQGAKGTTGSSGSLLANQLFQQSANRQRNALQNQGIVGAENLANQQLNQQLARLNAFGGLSQSDITNQLAAQQATTGDLFGSQASQINLANAINAARLGNVAQQNAASQQGIGNIFGGVGAGANFGKDIASVFS